MFYPISSQLVSRSRAGAGRLTRRTASNRSVRFSLVEAESVDARVETDDARPTVSGNPRRGVRPGV